MVLGGWEGTRSASFSRTLFSTNQTQRRLDFHRCYLLYRVQVFRIEFGDQDAGVFCTAGQTNARPQ